MTSAATPKGARRRSHLIEAAGSLLLEGGFDAVRHRAVADRAGLPLASTTYYFASLEDLMAEAAAYVCRRDEADIAARAESLTRRRRGAAAAADALAEVFVGPDADVRQLAARYEMIALASRYTSLGCVVADRRNLLATTHADVLGKSSRRADPTHITRLIAVEDGAIMTSLGWSETTPLVATREALADVMDVLAPRSG